MNDKEIENLKEGRKNAYTGWFYAIQRIDLLIISISGAGVYVTLESLKYTFEKDIQNVYLLKIAGVLFVLAIITNFFSQYFGKEANEYHIRMCSAKLKADEPPTDMQETEIKNLDRRSEMWDNLTNWSNYLSAILMAIALIAEIVFFFITF